MAIDLDKFATARMWCYGDDESHEQEKIKSAEFLPGQRCADGGIGLQSFSSWSGLA
jgi:hypothetical protein